MPWEVKRCKISSEAFCVANRSIFDNVLQMKHTLEFASQNHINDSFVLLLDLDKAYDRMMRDSIRAVLAKLGFPSSFLFLFDELNRSVKASVMVNGAISRKIDLKSGVRQGDPLSPLLFNFGMELLAQAFLKCKEFSGLRAYEFSQQKAKISMFADDSAIFGNGKQDFEIAKKLIQSFQQATGSKLNESKSSILLPNKKLSFDFTPFSTPKMGMIDTLDLKCQIQVYIQLLVKK